LEAHCISLCQWNVSPIFYSNFSCFNDRKSNIENFKSENIHTGLNYFIDAISENET
jgi:hypothetical protein